LKRLFRNIVCVFMAISLIACGNSTDSENNKTTEEIMPAEPAEADIMAINEINENSTLFCELYGDMGNEKEPYFLDSSGKSNAVAVMIPKTNGTLRVKEIELLDEQYDLFGMAVGISQNDFEREIIKRGYSSFQKIDSMRYKSFSNGNIYVAINYDENSKVDQIFINILVDYNEWRAIE